MIALGSKVRDRVSGFTGIVTARLEYLNGCVQFNVKPPVDDKGAMVEAQWIDDQQLELIQADALTVAQKKTGGPSSNAPHTYRG